jgi:hypothetical protein
VAVNCTLDWPEPTVALAGTLTLPLALVRLTVIALDAAPVRLTVQADVPGAFTVPGAQLNPLSCTLAANVTVAVWLCAPLVAVTVTVCPVATVPAVTAKVAVPDPIPTVTLAGAVNAVLLLATPTVIALAAALLRLTVQVAEAPAPKVFGVQLSPLNCAGALRFSVKFCVTPLELAVRAAV